LNYTPVNVKRHSDPNFLFFRLGNFYFFMFRVFLALFTKFLELQFFLIFDWIL